MSTVSKSNADLKIKVSELEKSLDEKLEIIETQKTRISRLAETRKSTMQSSTKLSEGLKAKDGEISKLSES